MESERKGGESSLPFLRFLTIDHIRIGRCVFIDIFGSAYMKNAAWAFWQVDQLGKTTGNLQGIDDRLEGISLGQRHLRGPGVELAVATRVRTGCGTTLARETD